MSASTLSKLLPDFCQIISSASKSWRGQFWFLIGAVGWKGWLVVVLALLVWTALEILLGYGNSANGFSWQFNVAVGSFVFAVFQTVIVFILSAIFGDGVYCMGWPILFHLLPFVATGAFLRWIGFLVY